MTPRDYPDDWSEQQRALYTRVHKFMVANKAAMCHPMASVVSEEHWQTTAHNAAWLAAEFLDCETLTIRDDETDNVIAASPQALNS